jgi:hypothetical protein
MVEPHRELVTLDELVEVVAEADGGRDLYIRWSRGPDRDRGTTSVDELTGVALPGLSANSLRVESWWADRSLRTWVARRLHDYRHLRRDGQGCAVRPWVLRGREVGRGPDNEPLIDVREPIAWIHEDVLTEVDTALSEQRPDWGTLVRGT